MEVLAPVGSMDSLKAAVAGGADAVYLGGKEFGARRLAENFTDNQLRGAVTFAHDNGVKVYITSNILVKEGELSAALSYALFLDSMEVDAIIVQDRGLLSLIRESSDIPIHASTQMGIHTPEGVEWSKENGISRVILARELSFQELSNIAEKTDIELEVFVHGALCYSVSGQCLFSSLVGGRSGNRGLCAQPCRKRYRLGEDEGYLLSTADLFSVEHIPHLLDIGIDCIKIEGRMRGPLYTYYSSLIYSRAVSRAKQGEKQLIAPRETELLEVAFNRGFTGGFMGEDDVMQKRYPESRGRPQGIAMMTEGGLAFSRDGIDVGDGISLYQNGEKVGGFEIARLERKRGKLIASPPFSLPRGPYDVFKTKDREFDEALAEIRGLDIPEMPTCRKGIELEFDSVVRSPGKPSLSCYLSSLRSLASVLPHADRVYFELGSQMDDARDLCSDNGIEFVPLLPRISPQIPEISGDSIMACSVDQLQKYKERRLFGHYSLNFFNSQNIPRIHQYTLSVELSRDEIMEVSGHYKGGLEVMVFGRIEIMVTRDPSLREGALVDSGGRKFMVYRDKWGFAHLLNHADLLLIDHIEEIESMGIDSLGLDLRRRDPFLCEMVARAFKERDLRRKGNIKRKCGRVTYGHYLRGVT